MLASQTVCTVVKVHVVVAWLAQKRSVAQTEDNVKVRKESLGFWTEETKRVEM